MDVEQMHTAASKEYKENYSTGEYCHEQSFLWGFQEGVEFSELNAGKELLYVAQKTTERTKKEIINKACEWLKNTIDDDVFINCGSVIKIMPANEFVEHFRKAMEE